LNRPFIKIALVAAGLSGCLLVTSSNAADLLQWTYKRGDKALVGGVTDVSTDALLPPTDVVKVSTQNFTERPYIAECAVNGGAKPTATGGKAKYGSSFYVERMSPDSFHVVAADAQLVSIETTKMPNGCQIDKPTIKASDVDTTVTVKVGEKIVVPAGEGHTVELLLTTVAD
jgi:hypothetical protein